MKKKSDVSKNQEIELPKKRITLANNVSVETEEKKSVFIGHAAPIKNEEEARLFIESKRREYHDATHNCYAYMLNFGAIARYSDDGEPSGTAGVPILNVLKMSSATDLIVVVTRYFGGILLGAGGLVRAYTASAKSAVDAAGFAVYEEYSLIKMTVSYSDYQKLTVALEKIGATEENCEFGENVSLISAIEKTRTSELIDLVSKLTYGKGSTLIVGSEERAASKK